MPSTKTHPWRGRGEFISDVVWDRELCSGREGPLLPILYPTLSFLSGLGCGLGQETWDRHACWVSTCQRNVSTGCGCWVWGPVMFALQKRVGIHLCWLEQRKGGQRQGLWGRLSKGDSREGGRRRGARRSTCISVSGVWTRCSLGKCGMDRLSNTQCGRELWMKKPV